MSPDSTHVVAAPSLQDHLMVWRTAGGERVAELRIPESEVSDCAWSRDGRVIISAHMDGSLTTWQPERWKRLREFEVGKPSPAKACAVSEDANVLVSGDWEGILHVFDGQTNKERSTLRSHEGGVNDCALSPDGSTAATVGKDGYLRIWDLTKGSECVAAPLSSEAGCVDLSPAGPRIAIGDTAGDLRIFDMVGVGYQPASTHFHKLSGSARLGIPASRKRGLAGSEE